MSKNLSFKEIYNSLLNNVITCEDAVDLMNSEEYQKKINFYLESFTKDDCVLSTTELDELKHIISVAYYIYDNSGMDTGITDTEYDKLIELYSSNTGEHIFSLEMNSNTEKDHHKYPVLRGTLEKIYYLTKEEGKEKVNKHRKGLEDWKKQCVNIYKEKTGEILDIDNVEIYCFPKWDGVSCVFEFDSDGNLIKALTRGFTELNTAENITRHFKNMEQPLHGVPYGLKTEVVATEEGLREYNEKYKKDYKQTRSIVSAILNSKESDYEKQKYLIPIPLRYIEDGSDNEIEMNCDEVFNYPIIRCRVKDTDIIEEFSSKCKNIRGIRCDGAVIQIIDKDIQKILGRKNDKNKFEVAYKFTEEYTYSKVKDIEFQIGLFGRITPVVKIKPVKLKGNTISSISLDSIENFEELRLSEGDTVKVLYDIRPCLTMDKKCNRHHKYYKLPKYCPDCGELLTRTGSLLYCENKKCPSVEKGKILNYLIKMNIDGISYRTISTLYDLGIVLSIPDLYKLADEFEDLICIDGFGEVSVRNMIDSINSKLDVYDDVFLGSIGIEGASQKTFATVLSEYNMSDLIEFAKSNDWEVLRYISGIGEKKSKKILKGILDNLDLIKDLQKYVRVHERDIKENKFTVCFTKIRDEDIEKRIESYGGEIVDSVTKNTDIVVVPMLGIQSSKADKALKYNIPIVPIDDVESYIVRNFVKKEVDIIR